MGQWEERAFSDLEAMSVYPSCLALLEQPPPPPQPLSCLRGWLPCWRHVEVGDPPPPGSEWKGLGRLKGTATEWLPAQSEPGPDGPESS